MSQTHVAGASGAEPLSVTEVAPGVFVHRGRHVDIDDPARGDSANIGFIVGERCVAVVDSGGSLATGQALRAAIAAQTPLPVCYVINTHAHFDHVLGNAAFAADGPQLVGHANLGPSLAANQTYFAERFATELAGATLGVPDIAVDPTLELDLGARTLLLTAVAEAHTAADLTVLDVATGSLWSGDLLFMERLPVLNGSLRGWLEWLETAHGIKASRVIPGHGPVSAPWPAALGPERDYLSGLLKAAREAVAAGTFLEDVTADAESRAPADWLLTSPHARNLGKAYREVEWE